MHQMATLIYIYIYTVYISNNIKNLQIVLKNFKIFRNWGKNLRKN